VFKGIAFPIFGMMVMPTRSLSQSADDADQRRCRTHRRFGDSPPTCRLL